jgi:DNA-binding response OmpR family regulator
LTASTLEECDQLLSRHPSIALALVGLAGFDRQIWTRCNALTRASIPFVAIVPPQRAAVYQASLPQGARGLLVKPVAMRELRALIRHLVET